MPQDAITQANPLPGLAKLYLLQLYPLALAMLFARFTLAAIGIEGGAEPVIWSVVFFGFGITSIAVIAGIHSRASWARSYAAGLNLGLCFLCLAGLMRVLVLVSQGRLLSYGFDAEEIFAAIAPAMLAMYIPIFFAWRRYFGESEKLNEIFGRTAPLNTTLPPVGVGILQTLSLSFLAFYLIFFLVLAVADGAKAFSAGGYVLLVDSLPQVAFLIIFFALCMSPGRKLKPLLIALTAFALLVEVWEHMPYLLMNLLLIGDATYSIYDLLQKFDALPMDNLVMAFLVVMLAWKIWADPAEQAWFAGAQTTGRAPSTFSLYNIVLLYYSLSGLTSGLFTLAYSLCEEGAGSSWTSIAISALAAVTVALHCLAIYNRTAKRWNDKTLSAASFTATAVMALAVVGILLFDAFSAVELRYKFYALSYSLPVHLASLAVSVMALLHWRTEYASRGENALQRTGLFSLRGPLQAFAIFCILLMTAMLTKKMTNIAEQLLLSEDDYFMRESVSLVSMLLDFEFCVAYIICPVLTLRWLHKAFLKRKNFYVLGVIRVCAILPSVINELISFGRYYALSLSSRQAIDPMKQVYIYVIILFMVYMASTKKKMPGEIENR